ARPPPLSRRACRCIGCAVGAGHRLDVDADLGDRAVRKLTAAAVAWRAAVIAILATMPGPVFAHPLHPGDDAFAALTPALLVALLVMTAAGYAGGVARLWRKAGS